MPSRRYLVPLLAGIGMFFAVYAIDAILAQVGLHAEQTYLDDVLLGCVAALLVFFLQRHQHEELQRQRQSAVVIEQMNHHIRNALQVIVSRTNLTIRSDVELRQLNTAIDRIDWALREILPRSIDSPSRAEPTSDDFAWPPQPPASPGDRSAGITGG